MKRMTLFDVLCNVIIGMSSKNKVNKKALNEVLDSNNYNDVNYYLYDYYKRIYSTLKQRQNVNKYTMRISFDFHYMSEFDTKEDFNAWCKDLGGRVYKKDYDYKSLDSIKQRHTKMFISYSNGYVAWVSWCFDVNEYLRVNDIEISD